MDDQLGMNGPHLKRLLKRIARMNAAELRQFTFVLHHIKFEECGETDLPGRCWVWTGSRDDRKGTAYPKSKIAGKMWRVHRWTRGVFFTPMLPHEDGHHKCNNPLCINPFHIQPKPCHLHSCRPAPSNAHAPF